jgi:ABC-2 type transport system ATP-binding protein
MLQLRDVHKRYGRVAALAGLDLDLERGELFGLLGPSGAGKSTALRVVAGLTRPDRGRVLVAGVDRADQPGIARRLTGAHVGRPACWDHLTCQQNLVLLADLQGAPRSEVPLLLRTVGLQAGALRRAGEASAGERQRLALAAALLGEPQLLVLDEPTVGLDPHGRQDLLGLIRRLARDRDLTVLLTSHAFAEVSAVCDRVGLLLRGRLAFCGPATDADALRERYFACTGRQVPA